MSTWLDPKHRWHCSTNNRNPNKEMKTTFLDYDVVKARRQLAGEVPPGTIGTVLMVFTSEPTSYEVEFVDVAGDSLAVLTVLEGDLEFVQHGR
jgi:hypothetical protein